MCIIIYATCLYSFWSVRTNEKSLYLETFYSFFMGLIRESCLIYNAEKVGNEIRTSNKLWLPFVLLICCFACSSDIESQSTTGQQRCAQELQLRLFLFFHGRKYIPFSFYWISVKINHLYWCSFHFIALKIYYKYSINSFIINKVNCFCHVTLN